MTATARLACILLTTLCMPAMPFAARAQSKDVPIETERDQPSPAQLAQAEQLRKDGRLLNSDAIVAQLAAPVPAPVQLAAVLDKPLAAHDVAKRARAGSVHIGWYYHCPYCGQWHIKLAGGYAIARDTIATARHCVDPANLAMLEGYLIAVDSQGRILPVKAILAVNPVMDACVLRVAADDLTPLALNDNVGPGDTAYCLSDPLGCDGYFSQGMVNRFYRLLVRPGDPGKTGGNNLLRMNVSTDWAPGSSGAAVLDEYGNVIGHVDTISPLSEAPNQAMPPPQLKPGATAPAINDPAPLPPRTGVRGLNGVVLITLHTAIPARSVLSLVHDLNSAPAPTAPTASATPSPK